MKEEYDATNIQSWNDVTLTAVMLEYCTDTLEEAGGREIGRK